MRLLIQRVQKASVSLAPGNQLHSSIGKGLLVFIGINNTDSITDIPWLAKKLVELRIFADAQDKMNLSALEVNVEILIISQFTLYADCRRGRRPDFISAAEPQTANLLYEAFVQAVKDTGIIVKTGVFAADMQVSLIIDGPVTIILDSKCK